MWDHLYCYVISYIAKQYVQILITLTRRCIGDYPQRACEGAPRPRQGQGTAGGMAQRVWRVAGRWVTRAHKSTMCRLMLF
ncbi:hypothetical protein CEY04_29525 [Achromobacter sp. HZ28]|nr:hypothetical protein CEY04_29525 [Achromobacter sp. HZ28]OWT78511.1 hypothetical protein CEY05_11525 [Achromobacter sp. HZ34]